MDLKGGEVFVFICKNYIFRVYLYGDLNVYFEN